MDGDVPAAQVAGLLIALRQKGERPAEIVGFARTMRARAVPLRGRGPTRSTRAAPAATARTFNISTVAAIVVAACGVRGRQARQPSASSRCGSADVFEALGVDVAAGPASSKPARRGRLAFFFAPTYHPRCATRPRCAASSASAPRSTCSAR
jgi:anthranilate phosphoribosyltransferase